MRPLRFVIVVVGCLSLGAVGGVAVNTPKQGARGAPGPRGAPGAQGVQGLPAPIGSEGVCVSMDSTGTYVSSVAQPIYSRDGSVVSCGSGFFVTVNGR